jgi:hypothetical protein
MSDTPRTDAKRSGDKHFMGDWVNANFACQLERELNAANEMFLKLNIHALNLTDRIRRLEEAGDNLEYASVISEAGEDPNGFEKLLIAQRKWNKAKKA